MADYMTIVRALDGEPNGSDGYMCKCPAHGDGRTRHLHVSEKNGKILLHCMKGTCTQEQVIAALRERGLWNGKGNNGSSLPPAAVELKPAREKVPKEEPTFILPVPEDREEELRAAPREDWCAKKYGELAGVWDYRDSEGRLLYVRARFNQADGGKNFRPFCLTAEGSRALDPLKGKLAPLYRLPALAAAETKAPVLLLEGERKTDVAAAYMADAGLSHVAMGLSNGAGSVGKVDWEPLRGRRVVLWPDKDKPGFDAMAEVSKVLALMGCRVSTITPPEELQEGGDIADLNAADWAASQIRALIEKAPQGTGSDFLQALVSFRDRQTAEVPDRTWYVDGMICPGFNMLTARKAMGKSFFLMQMADAIARGEPLLGRPTVKAKVLLVSFELDERDTAERFRSMQPLSEDAYLLHAWSTGEKAFEDAERAFKDFGIGVLMFDTFLPMLPRDPDFKLNEYGDSEVYLKWRLLAKRNNAAIVASWHEGKTPRDDFMLNAIGSTGMVAQADSVISIDRKRGDATGRLFTAGNHAKDSALYIVFENGLFRLGEGEISLNRLTPDEEKTMAVLAKHPEGAKTALVAIEMGKSEEAARKALSRLEARKLVVKITRGLYGIATNEQLSL